MISRSRLYLSAPYHLSFLRSITYSREHSSATWSYSTARQPSFSLEIEHSRAVIRSGIAVIYFNDDTDRLPVSQRSQMGRGDEAKTCNQDKGIVEFDFKVI